jgi:hypothetical protein
MNVLESPGERLYAVFPGMEKPSQASETDPDSAVTPVLRIVKVRSTVCPTGTEPKSREVGEMLQTGAAGCPVPVAVTDPQRDEPVAMVTDLAPGLVGENRTVALKLCPAPRL